MAVGRVEGVGGHKGSAITPSFPLPPLRSISRSVSFSPKLGLRWKLRSALDPSYVDPLPRDHALAHILMRRAGSGDEREATDFSHHSFILGANGVG